MKTVLTLCLLLFTFSVVKADDIADAKAAFATLLEYQKSDDPRSLELFSSDCTVTITLTDGRSSKSVVVPPDKFREMLTAEIAKKLGNKDTYENIEYVQEGAGVRVTSTILYAANGKREPFSALYRRDKNGVLKIKEMKVSTFVGTDTSI